MCKDQFNINTFILITKLLEKRINIHNPLDITFSNAKCLWQFPHRKKIVTFNPSCMYKDQ